MNSKFTKQLFVVFVYPIPVILVLVLILYHAGLTIWIQSLILISFCTIWLIYAIKSINKLRDSFALLHRLLKNLIEGKPVEVEQGQHFIGCDALFDMTRDVSEVMIKQQRELKEERYQRLRSVIDGQDHERQRLSRELHDGLGQSLIAAKLQLENAGSLGHSQMRASIDVTKGMIDQTIDEVRRVSNALMPAALNEFGLVTALRSRCEEMANASGVQLILESEGNIDRLEPRSKTYLYRIAQEAITNTIKHARASKLNLLLKRSGSEVIMKVTDNGKGFIFDPLSFAHRNGIQNMRERVALLHGHIDFQSEPDKGTQITVTIPYKTGNGKNQNHPG